MDGKSLGDMAMALVRDANGGLGDPEDRGVHFTRTAHLTQKMNI